MTPENALSPKDFEKYFGVCRDLPGYVRSLPENILDNLYESSASCLCIFRTLPKLGKIFVMRMLYVEVPVHIAVVKTWCLSEFEKEFEEVSSTLKSLRIWVDAAVTGGLPAVGLSNKFRHNLKVAFLGGGRAWTDSKNISADGKMKTEKELDEYALGRWEAILQFMTDAKGKSGLVSADTIKVLVHAGLMVMPDDKGRPTITSRGFQFLLLDTASQVWFFVVKYLEMVEILKMSLIECLSMLFSLSLSGLGKNYSTEGLTEPMLEFVQQLREFGLVYQKSRNTNAYFPTKLAVDWCSSLTKISWDTDKHKTGFLIVETNYRVYAYTSSELQIALVAMFTQFLYRLPNVVVAQISRESISQALRNGISAEQVISFMQTHLHPQMSAQADLVTVGLPPTVVDQIRLWSLERKRLTFTDSVLYNQFLSHDDYETVKDYAANTGALVHCSDTKRIVVVTGDGHERVRKFWKQHSKGQ